MLASRPSARHQRGGVCIGRRAAIAVHSRAAAEEKTREPVHASLQPCHRPHSAVRRVVVLGQKAESCDAACQRSGLHCDASQMDFLNDCEVCAAVPEGGLPLVEQHCPFRSCRNTFRANEAVLAAWLVLTFPTTSSTRWMRVVSGCPHHTSQGPFQEGVPSQVFDGGTTWPV